jgi:hypothetical protein
VRILEDLQMATLMCVGALSAPLTPASVYAQATTWKTVSLSQHMSIQVPPSWLVDSDSAKATAAERGNTAAEAAGLPQGPGQLVFSARDVSPGQHAHVTVSVIPGHCASQGDVAPLTLARIASIDRDFRADLTASMLQEGFQILDYKGTTKERLGSAWSLVARYTYRLPNTVPLLTESHRIFLGDRSVGLILDREVGASLAVDSTLARIRSSFVVVPDRGS